MLDRPRDYRYRLIGDVVGRILREHAVGKRVSEIPAQRPPSTVFSLYSEAVNRARPVCARLPYVGNDPFIDHVEAMITPLTEDGHGIKLLWATVVPVETDR